MMTLLLPAVSRSGAPMVDVVHCVDIFDLCAALPDHSVDLILCDLPYGTTACAWDTIIPFEPMWTAFKRIVKPKGAIVLTAIQPFSSRLIMFNLKWFRYEWVWVKTMATGFLGAKRKPLRAHEQILVFGKGLPRYYPQMTTGEKIVRNHKEDDRAAVYGKHQRSDYDSNSQRYPVSWLLVSNGHAGISYHPTQKPVALFEYLIRTYTRPGDLVFDPCVGSGTTALAARNTGRHYICGDSSPEYVAIAKQRLAQPYTPSFLDTLAAGESLEKHDQASLLEVKS